MARENTRTPNIFALRHDAPELPRLAYPVQIRRPASSRVTVLTPGAGDIVTVGQAVLISWQTSCLPGLLLSYIQLSTDGGNTYSWDISPLLDGKECHYLWTPTEELITPAARLRVVAINWGEATNNGSFRIVRSDRRQHVPALPVSV